MKGMGGGWRSTFAEAGVGSKTPILGGGQGESPHPLVLFFFFLDTNDIIFKTHSFFFF
jgi:hypothetical protein